MEIASLRDILIVVSGLAVVLGAVVALVFAVVLYRRLNSIKKSIRHSTVAVRQIRTFAGKEAARPLIRGLAVLEGVLYGIRVARKFRKQGG